MSISSSARRPGTLTARQRARNRRSVSSRRSTDVIWRAGGAATRPAWPLLRGARRSASSVIALGDLQPARHQLDQVVLQRARIQPADDRRDGAQHLVAALRRARGEPRSSARSTSKRATGTDASSSARIAAAPSRCDHVGRILPRREPHDAAARAAPRDAPSLRHADAPALPTAFWPAASASRQSSTVGASGASSSSLVARSAPCPSSATDVADARPGAARSRPCSPRRAPPARPSPPAARARSVP